MSEVVSRHVETRRQSRHRTPERPHRRMLEGGRRTIRTIPVEHHVQAPVKDTPRPEVKEFSDKNEQKLHPAFNKDYFIFKKKYFDTRGRGWKGFLKNTIGQTFHAKDSEGNTVLAAKQKGLKAKEDIRVYADTEQSDELLAITNDSIRDFSGKFVVKDSQTDEVIGSIRRHGWKSQLRDEWEVLNPEGQRMGTIKEQSKHGSAYLKRGYSLVKSLVGLVPVLGVVSEAFPSPYIFSPQKFVVSDNAGEEVANIKHSQRLGFSLSMDVKQPEPSIDRRLLVASSVLLSAIEGKQT